MAHINFLKVKKARANYRMNLIFGSVKLSSLRYESFREENS
jgi:hypothetical protein